MRQKLDAPWLDQNQQQIWRIYLLGSARILQFLDEDLREFDIDLGEYEILMALSDQPDWKTRMSNLAQLVHQSRSRLTHAVARLEKKGLLTRHQAEADRRGVLAVLTEKGFELLKDAAPHHVRAVRKILVDVVDENDFVALGRVMQSVLNVKD